MKKKLNNHEIFDETESWENEIFQEIVDAFLFNERRRITSFLAAGVTRLKNFEFADWDSFCYFYLQK